MITNANTQNINCDANSMPDVTDAVQSLLQPVTMQLVRKTVVAGRIQEVVQTIQTLASRQPFTAQQLNIKPEGQRAWRWQMIHATPDLKLKTDDRIKLHGTPYRIMEKYDWTEYGFILYHAIEDYK